MSSETGKPTLYERLGGVYSIAAVVDDFIDRVMHNPVLNANAAVDEAHRRAAGDLAPRLRQCVKLRRDCRPAPVCRCSASHYVSLF
jgi:hypothetical protein